MNYKLGIIGGMGPRATSVFFHQIIENTNAYVDQDHIDMVILNHSTLPDRTKMILDEGEGIFLDYIHNDIKLLERIGVDHIAIPCNTSHYFYNSMQDITPIPIVNMVEETVKKIYQTYGSHNKVGILATDGTIRSEIYKKECEKYGLNLHLPNDSLQEKIMNIIFKGVKGDSMTNFITLEEIINTLIHDEECICVILACTELSCIKIHDDLLPYCIDSLKVLVEKVIRLSGKELKQYQSV